MPYDDEDDWVGVPPEGRYSRDRAKPEFDDVERAASETGLAPHEVASRAEEAWRRRAEATRSAPDGDAFPEDPEPA